MEMSAVPNIAKERHESGAKTIILADNEEPANSQRHKGLQVT
jgi:hypothetical protein